MNLIPRIATVIVLAAGTLAACGSDEPAGPADQPTTTVPMTDTTDDHMMTDTTDDHMMTDTTVSGG